MLIILELIFLAAGLWTLVSGRLPEGLFRLLFGKGNYELPANQARLYGLLLASPLPISLMAVFLLAVIFGERSTGMALAFENIYFLVILISSIVNARKIRQPVEQESEASIDETADLQESRSYSMRLLIIVGLAFATFLTLISVGTLIFTIFSITYYGSSMTSKFSEDYLPLILLFVASGIGIFGTYKLIMLLRE